MAVQQVEAVWAWNYNLSAQKATYGRFTDNPTDRSFTKDYLQVSGANRVLLETVFPSLLSAPRIDLQYEWPGGASPGFVKFSVDRYHLSWPTGNGGPPPWRLTQSPTAAGPETFPGDPFATTQATADSALAGYRSLGLDGVLIAIKLSGEVAKLHLRAYVGSPTSALAFASTGLLPSLVRPLTTGFTPSKACRSTQVAPGTLYFDPSALHDGWSTSRPATTSIGIAASSTLAAPVTTSATVPPSSQSNGPEASDDGAAEAAPFDAAEVDSITKSFESGDFSVPDALSTVKTRGSAQQVFAKAVKANYGYRCAITGISTKSFLVASHIVPWAEDQTIRTDPSNGICLSTLVDRAFDSGYLSIGVDYVVTINTDKISGDPALEAALSQYAGLTLTMPTAAPPKEQYLARRLKKG